MADLSGRVPLVGLVSGYCFAGTMLVEIRGVDWDGRLMRREGVLIWEWGAVRQKEEACKEGKEG